ncbi:MAG: 23S rRNA (guanosine(2251)-2'-O)-methyltransferase RlmB [Candidatus Dasytiphilus stammeri]
MKEIVFGIHAVKAIIKSNPKRCQSVYIIKDRKLNLRFKDIIWLLQHHSILIKQVSRKWMNSKTDGLVHQGIMAIVNSASISSEKDLKNFIKNKISPLILILDSITDPYNLGSCLRSANAAGVDAVIIPKDRSAQVNSPIVKKVACGATENLALFSVTNINRTLRIIQEHQIWIIGTTEHSKHNLYQSNMIGATALVMGSESKGIRNLTCKYCNELISIPTRGSISSINVSVATGICLFEAVRQRYFKKKNDNF